MAKTFRVDVVSPDQLLFSGDATFLRAQTTAGEVGILASHAPLFAELAPGGFIVVTLDDETKVAMAAQGGFVSVTGDAVKVLAESAQLAAEIDLPAAQSALESAEEGSVEYLEARSRIRAAEALN